MLKRSRDFPDVEPTLHVALTVGPCPSMNRLTSTLPPARYVVSDTGTILNWLLYRPILIIVKKFEGCLFAMYYLTNTSKRAFMYIHTKKVQSLPCPDSCYHTEYAEALLPEYLPSSSSNLVQLLEAGGLIRISCGQQVT